MQVFVARAGKELGSFWMDEVRDKLRSGELKPTDHGWMEGRGDWKLLSEFPELTSALPAPAPPAEVPPPAEPAPRAPAAEAPAEQRVESPARTGRSKKAQAAKPRVAQPVETPATTNLEPKAPAAESPAPQPAASPATTEPEPKTPAGELPAGPPAGSPAPTPPALEPAVPESPMEHPLEPLPAPPTMEVAETSSPVEPEIAYSRTQEPETESEPEPVLAQPAPPDSTEAAAEAPLQPTHFPAVPKPIPTSGMAFASVVFGILSLTIFPFVGAICAIIFGYIAQGRIARARGALDGSSIARTGLKLGYAGFFLSLIVILGGVAWRISTSPPGRAQPDLMRSLSHAKLIATACQAYAVDHQGAFPRTLLELTPKYLPDPKMLTCPLSGPAVPIGYEYYGGKDTDPPSNILLASKARKRKWRVVAHVDSTVEVVGTMPELPPHER